MEERAAELADLAHELEESTANLVTQQARRFRSRGSSQEDGDDQSSGETSDREGGEEVFAIDSQDEAELVKGKLLKLERIRDGLKEAIRRGKQERIDKLARLHDYRFELEQLNAQDDDFAPLAPTHKPSPFRPLLVMMLFCAAVLLVLWVLQHKEVYHERLLSLRYLHPT